MTHEIVLLAGAQADLLELYSRHGEKMYSRVDAELESIRRMPELAPLYMQSIRRKVVAGSPYGLFYTIHGTRTCAKIRNDFAAD